MNDSSQARTVARLRLSSCTRQTSQKALELDNGFCDHRAASPLTRMPTRFYQDAAGASEAELHNL